jgi:ssDNA-binding Zn-finger/Zn-ribbon topoisomerase 1
MTSSPLYIRHKFSGHRFDKEQLEKLIGEGHIFIHYGDSDEEHKRYEQTYKRAYQRFEKLNESGGYVIADYRYLVDKYDLSDHDGVGDISVGRIEKGTREEIKTIHCEQCKKDHELTSTKFEKFTPLSRNDYGLFAIPFPRGTISRQSVIGVDKLKCMMEKRPLPDKVESLSPSQLETLCEEYLRKEDKGIEGLPTLDYLIAPVGRQLKDIDIAGLSKDGRIILAQVSYSSRSEEKTRQLEKASRGIEQAILLYFGKEPKKMNEKIKFVNVKRVYDEVKCDKRLNSMIKFFLKPQTK